MIVHPVHGPLRQHQARALEVARLVVSGHARSRVTTASVTPGGGKTLLASLFAHTLLDGGVVDRVVIVVPRDALRSQMRDNFTDTARGLCHHIADDGAKGSGAGQVTTARRETVGAVTTYQALARSPKRYLRRAKGRRTLVILDEPHHLADNETASWKIAAQALCEGATHVLLMSGTLRRHDGQRIPFVQYDADRNAQVDIRYSRRDAIGERAILPAEFVRFEGDAICFEWLGREHRMQLSEASKTREPKALRSFLIDARSRDEMVLAALRDWQDYRRTRYPSKAIVVCHAKYAARYVAKLIAERLKVDVALALDDEPSVGRTIRRFRLGLGGDVLVTVGMAYEGLDVPDATHLVCLTNIRSEPWLEQCFARVTRHNARAGLPWEDQKAYIYVPDDPTMLGVVNNIRAEQRESYRDPAEREAGEGPLRVIGPSTYKHRSAEAGEQRFADELGALADEESRLVRRVKTSFPSLIHLPVRELVKIGAALRPEALTPEGA